MNPDREADAFAAAGLKAVQLVSGGISADRQRHEAVSSAFVGDSRHLGVPRSAGLVIATVTPGSTAPLASVTCPMMVAEVPACLASASVAAYVKSPNTMAIAQKATRRERLHVCGAIRTSSGDSSGAERGYR